MFSSPIFTHKELHLPWIPHQAIPQSVWWAWRPRDPGAKRWSWRLYRKTKGFGGSFYGNTTENAYVGQWQVPSTFTLGYICNIDIICRINVQEYKEIELTCQLYATRSRIILVIQGVLTIYFQMRSKIRGFPWISEKSWQKRIGSLGSIIFDQQRLLVGGWTNPSEKYARQIGNLPQFSGWK